LLRGLGKIVVKEVKEMSRDPRILLGMILAPLIIFPLMGLMFSASTEAVQQSVKTMSVGIADLDHGSMAKNLTDFLQFYGNLSLQSITATNTEEIAAMAQDTNVTAVIVIPEGFSRNITQNLSGQLQIYGIFRGGGMAGSVGFSLVQGLVDAFTKNLTLQTVQQGFPQNPEFVLNPIDVTQGSVVQSNPVDVPPETLFSIVQSQLIGFPLAIFMLVILAMQLAATSVAAEKEEKTLETLMSLPLNRFTVLVGKLVGSTIIAAIGAVATIAGVIYYMGSFTIAGPTQPSIDLAAIGLTPTALGYVILGISVFVALLCALAVAIVVSVFAEDVRGAQSLLGFVYTPLVLPIFVLMFADINSLPLALRIVMFALPFTHPVLASQALMTGDYLLPALGIVYVVALTLVIMYLASRIFATEKILTMRLSLGRKKSKSSDA
jgi:ABC-2 type transport system permease protein